ncbi:rac GTPase-activating protein 1 [Lepisosteus oculatus]|nr:PREDICTED: rac GTPase-activating protein 1-like [Lepisosteus oculatus]XP_015214027.1 PREDICTED: rac GTPase-activating protein 1-like [Lepisosteus oculatus]XP_015214028.1 PREDICTED: rac GTPase-activating protein 1-like [Lepisosteus oculatus]XP_015214029.1 PREDICTED: rac GTPase-activating protein 1-like [Lepisosteus oculatus]XP_015214030.1 PREDICTED: rac GTPase-activating protein 1-like [Lepisosteus oculatus]XP_015214031.1 PREDICTED: rac GTPase-activating protein 1-like [Lepisosteus oculatus]
MGETFVKELLSLCLIKIAVDDNTNSELEFLHVVKNYEETRKKWLQSELELKKYKELLMKSELTKSALEVKLKHARNQVDVEMKKRHKAEADFEHLERQMQLICDVLMHDGQSGAYLNEEQKFVLANFNTRRSGVTHNMGRRLSVIDESGNSFLSHSDISYDRTDDDLDLDTSVVKPLKSRAREKRRSSLAPGVGPPLLPKRVRAGGRSGDFLGGKAAENVHCESIVTKTTVTLPEDRGHIQTVSTIETLPQRSFRNQQISSVTEQTTVWAVGEDTNGGNLTCVTEMEIDSNIKFQNVPAIPEEKGSRHTFISKTVIRPEACIPCGKRIKFGKMAVKCRNCRMVAHPECKDLFSQRCVPSVSGPSAQNFKGILANFAPSTPPMIPPIIVQCVNEIEKRGLQEIGIYRVPGCERVVKELREKYLLGKGVVSLSKVDDIHVICGLLKDFLRKLKEPILTFHLHKVFMDACEILDDDNSIAAMCQATGDLPQPNRETLAFLMLHLQRVMKSPFCKMDLNNLARVFGPTIVGHSVPEPSPMMIMRDTTLQPKVVARLLSLSEDYWKQFIMVESDRIISSVVDANINNDSNAMEKDRLFKPLTSPEMSGAFKTPSSGSLKGKFKTTLGTALNQPFNSKTKTESGRKKFFTSPN